MSGPYDPFGPSPFQGGSGQESSEPVNQGSSPPTPPPGYSQQPSQPAQSSGWGQSSTPLGQPDQPAQSSPWGQSGAPYSQPAEQSTAPSQPSPYGQPAAPSQPLGSGQYPYCQPAAPSQPFTSGAFGQPSDPFGMPSSPYGQPAAPSQPYPYAYGQPSGPSQPFTPGAFGQQPTWSPTSQTLPGGGMPQGTMGPVKKARRALWITLGSVAAAIALLGGGGLFAFSMYVAPLTAATSFCADLKAQSYVSAYNLLSSGMRSQLTQDQFVQGSQQLDKAEGAVTSCKQATGGNVYSYSLGASTATFNADITRATAGDMTGAVHLKNENGAWKVDGLDTSLTGANLGALVAAGTFCAALQSQNYASAYQLLGSLIQSNLKQTDFVAGAQIHDQIDGTVTACGLAAIGQGNTDTNTNITVSITRTKLGEKQGNVSLDTESGAWKVAAVAPALLGSDIGPLQVGAQMCTDLVSSDYAAIYDLTSSGFQAAVTKQQVVAYFTLNTGYKYTGCKADYSTYKVSSSDASYNVDIELSGPSGAFAIPFKLAFVNESNAWKLDDFAPVQ